MTEINTVEPGDTADRASEIVSGERESHGDAYDNMKQIADLWNAFLGSQVDEDIEAWQAAVMMQQVKQARMQAGGLIDDHFVDAAGYSDIALYSAEKDPDVEIEIEEV